MKPLEHLARPYAMRLGLVLAAATLVWGQNQAPTFRTGTRLVQVDVVVRDQGGALLDLTQSDFQLTDNGKPHDLAVFGLRKVDVSSTRTDLLPQGVVANRPQARSLEPVSATVILIDRQNTYPEDQGYARVQALKYLEGARSSEQIAIYTLGTTLKVTQGFTGDRQALYSAVEKSRVEQPFNLGTERFGLLAGIDHIPDMTLSAEKRRNEITAAALATVARQMDGLPGRKKLIWITASLPLTLTTDTLHYGIPVSEFYNLSPQLFDAMKMLNDANVALYPIDPRGLFKGALSDPNVTATIRLAEMTGGKAYYATNDLAAAINDAITDTDVTYTLGYYPTEDLLDGAFHDIKVQVARSGAEVRHRKGYWARTPVEPLTEPQRQDALADWMVEPLEATSLGVFGIARRVSNQPGYYAVEVLVDPAELQLEQKDDRWVGKFDVAIVPDNGRKLKGLEQRIDVNLSQEGYSRARVAGIVVANSVKVTDSKGQLIAPELKAVIMDEANGKAGSVHIPIQ